MKNTALVLAGTLLLTAPAAAQFEGMLEVKITAQGMTGHGKTYVGKPGVRSEVAIQNPQMPMSFTTLVKAATPDVLYRINDKARTYSVLDTKAMARDMKGSAPEETYTVKKLGNESVLGHSTKHVRVTGNQGTEMELWTTQEIFGSSSLWQGMGGRSDSGGFIKALKDADADGFPLKMIAMSDGKPAMTMEVVKAEKRSLQASLFEIPAGYTKEEAMMGGMMKSDLPPEVQKQLEEQMKSLTPEQQEMLRKAMQGQAPKK